MLMLAPALCSGGGVSRSTGLGMRVSFWNITGRSTQLSVRNEVGQATVDLGGAGAWLTFFSRAYQDWFFELHFGAVSGVRTGTSRFVANDVEIEAIVPLLFGLRYDIFAPRLHGSFQPYLSAGGGPYWATELKVSTGIGGSEETIYSNAEYGGYLGGGLYMALASWFAFNFDLKYHFVDLRPDKDYSGLEFGMGLTLMWGRKKEMIRIMDTRLIVQDIYPAYFPFYQTYPLALITVKNMFGGPVDVNVRCHVPGFSQRPKDSGFIRLESGEVRDIPVTAFLNSSLAELEQRRTAALDFIVEARASTVYRTQFSAQVTIHSFNAWDGDIEKLGLFITPEEEQIRQLSRDAAAEIEPELDEVTRNFRLARAVFRRLGGLGIGYHPDPNIPFYQDDRVQFARQTLEVGSGDCDDLAVLYASILEASGIKTAFVEIRDPEKEIGHLFILFDSGVPVHQGVLISSNEKRYVIRENTAGVRTAWIPVETTQIDEGFDRAWKDGALGYLEQGIIRAGLAQGWVKVIDVK